jgi:hypothetical protein
LDGRNAQRAVIHRCRTEWMQPTPSGGAGWRKYRSFADAWGTGEIDPFCDVRPDTTVGYRWTKEALSVFKETRSLVRPRSRYRRGGVLCRHSQPIPERVAPPALGGVDWLGPAVASAKDFRATLGSALAWLHVANVLTRKLQRLDLNAGNFESDSQTSSPTERMRT